MFNVGAGELLVILLVALIVLGPQRLPEAARTVGKVVGEIRRLSTGFQREIRDALEDADTSRQRPEPAPLAAAVADVDAEEPDADELPPTHGAAQPDGDQTAEAAGTTTASNGVAGASRASDDDARGGETTGAGVTPASTANGHAAEASRAPNGDTSAGETAGTAGAVATASASATAAVAASGEAPGGLAPEVGDAIDQVVAATPPSPTNDRPADPGDARDDVPAPTADVPEDGPGDARAAS